MNEWKEFVLGELAKIELYQENFEKKLVENGKPRKSKKPYKPTNKKMLQYEEVSEKHLECLKMVIPCFYDYTWNASWKEVFLKAFSVTNEQKARMDEETKREIIAACQKGARNTFDAYKNKTESGWFGQFVLFEEAYKVVRLEDLFESSKTRTKRIVIEDKHYEDIRESAVEAYGYLMSYVVHQGELDYPFAEHKEKGFHGPTKHFIQSGLIGAVDESRIYALINEYERKILKNDIHEIKKEYETYPTCVFSRDLQRKNIYEMNHVLFILEHFSSMMEIVGEKHGETLRNALQKYTEKIVDGKNGELDLYERMPKIENIKKAYSS